MLAIAVVTLVFLPATFTVVGTSLNVYVLCLTPRIDPVQHKLFQFPDRESENRFILDLAVLGSDCWSYMYRHSRLAISI